MVKTFLFAAFTANVIFAVSCTTTGSKCGGRPHEGWVQCPDTCAPQNCSQLGYPIACPEPRCDGGCSSKPGCVCHEGYVRNDKGICILKKDCPSCGGDINAVSGCGNCPTTCKNFNSNETIFCIQVCYSNACDCKDGFVLDENTNKCVCSDDCTPQCGPNEVFSTCSNGGCHTGRTCEQFESLGGNTICVRPKECEPGCVCKEGYYRNSTGICVAENQCPSRQCGGRANEHYAECPDECIPQKCSQLGFPIACPGVTEDGSCPFKPGCVCNDGYVRNDEEICIPINQCPSCGGDPHAEHGCGNCPKTCRNPNPEVCPQFCNLNGCDCKDGYLLDENTNLCVMPVNCTASCGPNEVYDSCSNGGCHTGRTCEDYYTLNGNTICVDPITCIPGCLCQEGLYRNKQGDCVPADMCEPSCGGDPNAKPGCGSNCGRRCSDLNFKTPQACPEYCMLNGCDCKDGFFYDSNIGKCVLPEQCNQCGNNEVYDTCVTTCPPRKCGINDAAVLCAPTNPDDCKGGCRCRDGYYRNPQGECVTWEECPPTCPEGEIYDSCPNPCPPQLCSVDETVIRCKAPPQPGDPECKPGCRCPDGYKRNDDGVCIPKEQCPQNCPEHEVFDLCPAPCPPQNCSVDERLILCAPAPKPGSPECKPSCRCEDGYKRNDKGICIPKDQCPPICPEGEIYDSCPNPCPPQLCSVDERVIRCAAPPQPGDTECVPSCRCPDGYKRNDNGVCIPKEQCPQYCPEHEVFDLCPAPCPPQNCSIDERLILCAPAPKPSSSECEPSCRCEDGYKRNDKGICIPKDQCPPFCYGANEVSDPCPDESDPNTCESIGKNYNCPRKGTDDVKQCKPACRCKPGYYRNKIGNCISKDECLKCTKPHEYYSCGGACDNVCSTLSQQNQTNCPIINIKCNEMCYCEEGYARDRKGNCVPISSCRSCRGAHEWYDTCPPNCPPNDSCDIYGKVYFCPAQTNATKCGKPSCRCEDNYLRDKNGVCIPQEQCPCNGDPNAEPGCGCSKTCSDYFAGKPPTCTKDCKLNACNCKDKYVLDEKSGMCVLPENCPAPQCPKNEVYDLCPATCPPETCPNGRLYKCAAPPKPGSPDCKPRCRCQDGYYRNGKGVCIPKAQCPPICNKPHEYYACGGACDNVCSTLSQQNQTNCPIVNIKCNDMCYCEKGYARDRQGNCVLISSCRSCKGAHEWYDTCPPNCPSNDSCDIYGKAYSCPAQTNATQCGKPSCRCEDNYLRDKNGVCIPQEQCPCNGDPNAEPGCGCSKTCSDYFAGKPPTCTKICKHNACNCKDNYVLDEKSGKCVLPENCPAPQCPKNEVYDLCPATCPPETCPDGRFYKCAAPPIPGSPDCKPRCRCQDGYYRNGKGVCIPKAQCPLICNKPHEYYACGGACDNVCSTLSQQNQTNCPIVNIKCNDMCYCEKGYARDRQGNCVLISSCRSCKGAHEWYDTCPPNCPSNDSCDIYGKAYSCPAQTNATQCGKPSCRCEDNYLRDKNGVCIPQEQCPCNGDPNAEPGCGCSKTCSDYFAGKPPTCTKICKHNACNCKDNYVLDEKSGKCVLPENCPAPQCPKNEVYDLCPATCPPETCPDGRFYKCAAPPVPGSPDCKPRCRCQDGYYRNGKGVCIPKAQCPLICNKPHEYYACGGACDNVCSTLSQQNQTNCPIVNKKCNDMCYCEKGYARDRQGNCVLISSCRSCRGAHEWYDTCPPKCPPNDSCDIYGKVYSCPARTNATKCGKPSCRCEDNYLRDKNGVCIPQEQCPCNGDPNAEPGCGCSKTCSDYFANKAPSCIQNSCKPNACNCKDKYVLDENCGMCVLPENCPAPQCPINEVYDLCPATCPPETCPDGRLYKCKAPPKPGSPDCKPRCRCQDGYYRNAKGVCIPKTQCPPICNKPHEYYACGGACDNVCSTLSQQNQTNCPIVNIKCNDKCYCEKGYARDRQGNCVPISECRSCKGKHEWYDTCPPTCPSSDSCDIYGRTYKCPAETNPPQCGKACCRCEDNYLRNKDGICVPKEQCVSPCGTNEEFSNCTQAICRHQECRKKGTPVACPGLLEGSCLKGCVCKVKFLRHENGTCIPEDLCPNTQSSTSTPIPEQPESPSNDDAQRALSQGINIFAFEFFKNVYKLKSGENLIMSPYSAQVPIAELALRAETDTLKQMLAALNLSNKNQIRQAFPEIIKASQGSDGVTLDKALAIFINKLYPMTQAFLNETQNIFNGTAENVDCSDSVGTSKLINDFVASSTNNRINNLIPPDAITVDTRLIMVNAIYFFANWEKQFNKNLTDLQDFYTYDNRTVQVNTMHQETNLYYTDDDDLNAQVVQLNYVNKNYTFLIVLPRERFGLAQTVAKLNYDTMNAALGNLRSTKVKLSLPTMEINTSLDLTDIFKALGLTNMFDPSKADFRGLITTNEKLFVSKALQKAFFKCNEEGSEAAAATALTAVGGSGPPSHVDTIYFIADHPFMFIIYCNHTPIFIGDFITGK